MSNPTKEALKEGGRYVISSLIGTLTICLGIIASSINLQTVTFTPNWMLIALTALLGFLNALIGGITRATDKYKHEVGKETSVYANGRTPSMGIFGF